MKKWSFLLLLFLISCTGELEIPIENEKGSQEEGSITLTLQIPGTKKPSVYGASADDENRVDEIDVLAFVNKGGIDKFSYRVKVNPSKISDATEAQQGNKKNVNFVLKRQEDPVRLVIIANGRAAIEAAGIVAEEPMSAIYNKLNFDFSSKWTVNPFTPFPMWGQTATYFSVKDPIVETTKPIVLLRSVVKVDVGVDVYGDPAIGFGTRFKLKHVYVYNANSKGSITPDMSDPDLSTNIVSIPNIPTGASKLSSPAMYEITDVDNKLFNEIYLPEAVAASVGSEGDATCLVVGGSFDGGDETFYKINFVKDDQSFLPLLRNYRYLVNITNVNREGYKTKEEALAARTSHINYSLGVTNENIVDISFNGQYVLGISDKNINLDWEGATSKSVAVVTDFPSGWTATTSDSWITLETSSGGVNGNLVFSATQNVQTAVREGVITIAAGSLIKTITIRQYLGANSYILKPGESVNIPIIMANMDGVTRLYTNESLSVNLLWKDVTGNVISNIDINGTGDTRYINCTAGSIEGNAVVAIVNSSNKIVWSWHIWVTNFDPNLTTNQKMYNKTVYMDRNLGAMNSNLNDVQSFGLIYQWGRKDPFPGASASVVGTKTKRAIYNNNNLLLSDGVDGVKYTKVTDDNNFENAIANPLTFYTNSEFPYYSWYGLSEIENNLWVDDKGKKTLYDPCPIGWRVPVSTSGSFSVWNGLQPSSGSWNTGYIWSSAGYYPATGGYDFSTGQMSDVAVRGYVWSANPAGAKAYNLNMGKTTVNTESSSYRANGYAVRCVKDQN